MGDKVADVAKQVGDVADKITGDGSETESEEG